MEKAKIVPFLIRKNRTCKTANLISIPRGKKNKIIC